MERLYGSGISTFASDATSNHRASLCSELHVNDRVAASGVRGTQSKTTITTVAAPPAGQ